MDEVLFTLGNFPVRAYGVMILCGYLAAVILAGHRARLKGLQPVLISDLGVVALVSGVLGARIFYVIQYRHDFSWTFFDPGVGGLSWVGACVGAVAGVLLFDFLAQSTWPLGKRARKIHPLAPWIWMGMGGILGIRIGYFLTQTPTQIWHGDPLEIFRIDHGGLVLYGGILLGIPSCTLFLLRKGVSLWKIADLAAPSLAVGLAFGRLGCFLNGCCLGKAVSGFPGICFPAQSPPWLHQVQARVLDACLPHSLPVIPTQILSSLGAMGLFWVCTWALHRGWRDGRVGALFLILYAPWRFIVECLRDDTLPVLGPLTLAQAISIPVFLGALFLFLGNRRKTHPSHDEVNRN